MKNILTTIGLLSIMTTISSASIFGIVSYGESITDVTLKDEGNTLIFPNNKIFQLKIGEVHFPSEEHENMFGWYMGVGLGASDNITYQSQNNEEELLYGSFLFTVGTTVAINNNIAFFGGLGIQHNFAGVTSADENSVSSDFVENKLNVNGGMMVYIGESKIGLSVEYDTAPKAISAGLNYRF